MAAESKPHAAERCQGRGKHTSGPRLWLRRGLTTVHRQCRRRRTPFHRELRSWFRTHREHPAGVLRGLGPKQFAIGWQPFFIRGQCLQRGEQRLQEQQL
jgi:hypothetical protein